MLSTSKLVQHIRVGPQSEIQLRLSCTCTLNHLVHTHEGLHALHNNSAPCHPANISCPCIFSKFNRKLIEQCIFYCALYMAINYKEITSKKVVLTIILVCNTREIMHYLTITVLWKVRVNTCEFFGRLLVFK